MRIEVATTCFSLVLLTACSGEQRRMGDGGTPSTTAASSTTAAAPEKPCQVDSHADYFPGGESHPSPEEAADAVLASGSWRYERVEGDKLQVTLRIFDRDSGVLVGTAQAVAEGGRWRLVSADRCAGATSPSPL